MTELCARHLTLPIFSKLSVHGERGEGVLGALPPRARLEEERLGVFPVVVVGRRRGRAAAALLERRDVRAERRVLAPEARDEEGLGNGDADAVRWTTGVRGPRGPGIRVEMAVEAVEQSTVLVHS